MPSTSEIPSDRPETPVKKTAGPRRRRLLRRILLLTLILLVLLVIVVPWVLSTSWGTRWMVGVASDRLRGELHVDDLSLGWFSPVTIRGIQVTDTDGRRVLDVASVRISKGLLGLLWSGQDFGEVTVSQPDVVLYLDADGKVSLAEALKPLKPSSPKEEGPLPAFHGELTLLDGSVRVVREERSIEWKDLTTRFKMNTLDAMTAEVAATPTGGEAISVGFDLSDLLRDGRIDPTGASGTIRVKVPNLDITPLAEFLGHSNLNGVFDLDATFAFKGRQINGELKAGVRGLSAPQLHQAEVKPLDLNLTAVVKTVDDNVSGTAVVLGPGVSLNAGFAVPGTLAQTRVDPQAFLNAALTGAAFPLPDIRFTANAGIDLSRLARAVPALLRIKKGVTLTSGKFTIKDLVLRGGMEPSLSGKIDLDDLTADVNGEGARLSPLHVVLDLSMRKGRGLVFGGTEVAAGFAGVSLDGRLSDLTAPFSVSTATLRREFGRIVDLGTMPFDGYVAGTARVARKTADRYAVRLDLGGVDWALSTGKREVKLKETRLGFAGDLVLADNQLRRVEKFTATVDLDDSRTLALRLEGNADLADRNADIEYHASFDLAPLIAYGGTLGRSFPRAVTGSGTAKGKAFWSGKDAAVTTSGDALIEKLRADGKALLDGAPLRLDWKNVRAPVDRSAVNLDAFELVGRSLVVKLKEAEWKQARNAFSGDVTVNATLEPLLADARYVLRDDNLPDVRGTLAVDAHVSASARELTVVGGGSIKKLLLRLPKGSYHEPEVTFEIGRLALDRVDNTIDVQNVRLGAPRTFAVTKLGGSVKRYHSTGDLDLTGHYEGNWERWIEILRVFAPETRNVVSFTGKTEGDFTVKGTANDPEVKPVFENLAGGVPLTWQAGKVYDVDIGEARLEPKLADGKVSIPLTEVAAEGGTFRLGGIIDFTSGKPEYHLEDETALMEGMPVTRTMARELLSRFNPIFANQASIEGKITLKVAGLKLPLGEAIKQRGEGRGRLDLSGLKIQPEGILAAILKLARRSTERPDPIEMSAVDFELKNGRVTFKNFALRFTDNFDLRFRGSVGFDDTVEVWVSVPVRTGLFERLGVTGPLGEYVKVLDDARIDVPIKGSRMLPKLDFSQVDVKPLLQLAVKRLILKKTRESTGILDGLPLPGGGMPRLPAPKDIPLPKPRPRLKLRDVMRDLMGDLLGPIDELEPDKP